MDKQKFLNHTNSEEAGTRVFAQTGLSGERIVKAVLQGGEKVCSWPQPIRRREDTRLTNQRNETTPTANNERRIHENYNRNITRHFLISHHSNTIL